MPPTIISAIKTGWASPTGPWRNARLAARRCHLSAEFIAVISLVGHDLQSDRKHQILCGDHIGTLSWSQRQLHRMAATVHQGGNFRVQLTLGATQSLIFLAPGGVARVLMHFNGRRIHTTQDTLSLLGQHVEYGGPETSLAPA